MAAGRRFPSDGPDAAARRLTAFLDGYAPGDALRAALPTTMGLRARALFHLLRRSHEAGEEPWRSMYLGSHGEHWDHAADNVVVTNTSGDVPSTGDAG